jgi:hypothetical protein
VRIAGTLAVALLLSFAAGCSLHLWAGSLDEPYELRVPPDAEPTPTPAPPTP